VDEAVRIEAVAAAALDGKALLTRHLAHTFLRQTARLAEVPEPAGVEGEVLAVAAAFLELFAERRGEALPAWAGKVEREGKPILFFPCKPGSAMYQVRLDEASESLRRQGLYSTRTYLTFA
jgi:hypothetical protein